MNQTVKNIIEEKTKILDWYTEGMTYYDIVGIPDKDWERIQRIKKNLEEKLAKENANLLEMNNALAEKIIELDDATKYTEAQLQKNKSKVEKIRETYKVKIDKIIAKIAELEDGLEGFPTQQVIVKKSDTLVRATAVKPEYMKYLNEKRETLKAKYGIK